MEDCFLCNPDPNLIYWSDCASIALCGLGPIVKGYTVAAVKKHIRSAADLDIDEETSYLFFVSELREKLTNIYGSCLLTEHGRIPVCQTLSGMAETHCYHAHFLLFPNVSIEEDAACAHFNTVNYASSFPEALNEARKHKGYFLLSPNPQRFLILTQPKEMVRQFARLLVAQSVKHPELAEWQRYPLYNEAALTASQLRTFFE